MPASVELSPLDRSSSGSGSRSSTLYLKEGARLDPQLGTPSCAVSAAFTDHLSGLVAWTEGRGVGSVIAAQAIADAVRESPSAARLRA